jgi:hypothetical protein
MGGKLDWQVPDRALTCGAARSGKTSMSHSPTPTPLVESNAIAILPRSTTARNGEPAYFTICPLERIPTRPVRYHWTFGDGQQGVMIGVSEVGVETVAHTYNLRGMMSVSVTATDASGRVGTASITIHVVE